MWEEPGSLKACRLAFWANTLPSVDIAEIELAHDAAHTEYVRQWEAGGQFRVEDAVALMMTILGGRAPRHAAGLLREGFSEGGRRAEIHTSAGVADCLRKLDKAGLRLGLVCDIGLTPSSVVRELLKRHALLQLFQATAFSDDIGYYKPARPLFEHALTRLGIKKADRAAHVGDRRRTDVAGARAMGMTSVRYRGVYDDESVGEPDADIVLAKMAELPTRLGVSETMIGPTPPRTD